MSGFRTSIYVNYFILFLKQTPTYMLLNFKKTSQLVFRARSDIVRSRENLKNCLIVELKIEEVNKL